MRLIDHVNALTLGLFQHVGRVDVFLIERRVLAHDDRIEIGQFNALFAGKLKPSVRIAFHPQQPAAGISMAVAEVKIGELQIMQFPASRLGLQQHGETGVFLDVDLVYGVHDHAEFDSHCCPFAGKTGENKSDSIKFIFRAVVYRLKFF